MPNSAGGLRPAPSVHTRLFDGELVILDLARGEYMALDAIGSRLWAGIEAGRSIADLAREIADEYDVTAEQARTDFETLVSELVSLGLLVRSDGEP